MGVDHKPPHHHAAPSASRTNDAKYGPRPGLARVYRMRPMVRCRYLTLATVEARHRNHASHTGQELVLRRLLAHAHHGCATEGVLYEVNVLRPGRCDRIDPASVFRRTQV